MLNKSRAKKAAPPDTRREEDVEFGKTFIYFILRFLAAEMKQHGLICP